MSTAPIPELESKASEPARAATFVSLPSMSAEALDTTLVHLNEVFSDRSTVVSSPDAEPHSGASGHLQFRQFTDGPRSQAAWVPVATDYLNAWSAAKSERPRVLLVLGHDAASISPATLRHLADAVVGGQDLVIPRYPVGPHDALVNSSILYPLSNALFQEPVRFPLPIDVAMSSRMAERLATAAQKHTASGHGDAFVWPAAEAAVAGYLVHEAEANVRTLPQPGADNLNDVLARVAGSLFADIETKAAFWQRARLATKAPLQEAWQPAAPAANDLDVAELAPMMEAFRNAYTNLRELWSLVLPPNALLGLKKLSLTTPAEFRMPDALWARTVYDFLLAYRLRTINRGHLLGAFTPLYLAWVASHLRLVGGDASRSEDHLQSVAAAFHADKPYLVFALALAGPLQSLALLLQKRRPSMGNQIEIALRASVHRVVVTLVQFLPGLLAFLLAILVLGGVGLLLALLVKRVLTSLHFDERLSSRQSPGSLTNLSEWSPANSPTLLLSRAVLWLCLLAGFAVGMSAFDASFSGGATGVSLFLLPYFTHTAGAALLLIVGVLLARFLSRSILVGAVNAHLQYARFLSLGVKWLVLVLSAAMALDHLQIGGSIVELAFGILFGGIVLTLALAIGLGSRELVSRSIEKTIDKPLVTFHPDIPATPPAANTSPLRHF